MRKHLDAEAARSASPEASDDVTDALAEFAHTQIFKFAVEALHGDEAHREWLMAAVDNYAAHGVVAPSPPGDPIRAELSANVGMRVGFQMGAQYHEGRIVLVDDGCVLLAAPEGFAGNIDTPGTFRIRYITAITWAEWWTVRDEPANTEGTEL